MTSQDSFLPSPGKKVVKGIESPKQTPAEYRQMLKDLTRIICGRCTQTAYEKCRKCRVYQLVNALLETI